MNSSFASRRGFIKAVALGAGAATFGAGLPAVQGAEKSRFLIGGFTKPFQKLSFEETADVVAEIGWDGVECPLRKGGQIEPERVEDDLPRYVETLHRRGLKVLTIATDIRDLRDPLSERVIRAAARAGIPIYRLAHIKYDPNRSFAAQIESIHQGFAELDQLNRELNIVAAYENHSGADSVGAAIWDLRELLHDLNPQRYQICFDIGHATIEGGYAWPTNFRLIEPRLAAVYVKDFRWVQEGNDWKAKWCPLGKGMIDRAFFQQLQKGSFRGTIIQHHEYPVGSGAPMIELMKNDLQVLRHWIAATA